MTKERMSKEEQKVWENFCRFNRIRVSWSDKPILSLVDWAQQGIINPAPLLEWHEKHKRGEFRK